MSLWGEITTCLLASEETFLVLSQWREEKSICSSGSRSCQNLSIASISVPSGNQGCSWVLLCQSSQDEGHKKWISTVDKNQWYLNSLQWKLRVRTDWKAVSTTGTTQEKQVTFFPPPHPYIRFSAFNAYANNFLACLLFSVCYREENYLHVWRLVLAWLEVRLEPETWETLRLKSSPSKNESAH